MPPVTPGPASDVLPASDLEFLAWAENVFDQLDSEDPLVFPPPPGLDYENVVSDYATALTAATDPPTRNAVTVETKNAKRAAAESESRLIVAWRRQLIREGTIDDANLELWGIRPIKARAPIPAPAIAPIVSCVKMLSNQTAFAARDPETPDRLALPYGVTGVEIQITTGAVTALGGVFSRANFVVDSDAAQIGNAASLRARYRTQRGLVGPWSASTPYIVT